MMDMMTASSTTSVYSIIPQDTWGLPHLWHEVHELGAVRERGRPAGYERPAVLVLHTRAGPVDHEPADRTDWDTAIPAVLSANHTMR